MPNTSSAKKALRQDRARAIGNNRQRTELRRALKTVSVQTLSATVSLVDKAVKTNLMHANKAARIKASLAKSIGIATTKRAAAGQAAAKAAKPVKKTSATKK